MFNCDDDFESGSSYLKADYRLECDGSEYDGYVNYALLMILVYPIGIPVFFLACLALNFRKIMSNTFNIASEDAEVSNCKKDLTGILTYDMLDAANRESNKQYKDDLQKRLRIERACLHLPTRPWSEPTSLSSGTGSALNA